MKTKIFRSTAAAMIAAAAVLATCAAAGETVTAEPDALLDYIEATGEQYINTGVNAEIGLKASIDFSWATFSGNPDWSLLDAATVSAKSDNRSRIFLCHMYNGKPFFAYGLKQRRNPANSVSFVGGQRCEIITDMSSTNSFELIQNGMNTFDATDREAFATNGIVNLHLNLFVFATNYGGRPDWKGQGKLYEMKIFKKNDTTGEFDLLRHYLPCIKDHRAGLYDEVNGTISFSAGSTNFIAGSVTNMFNAVKPAWAEQADDVKFWKWVYEKSVSDYASTDYTEQYLLNVAPSATPAELRIDSIEVGAGGATIRVTCRAGSSAEAGALAAGGTAVDLSQINGVICVEAGGALDALVPMAIPAANVTYSAGAATIAVPSSCGSFIKACIAVATPVPSDIVTPSINHALTWNGGSTQWKAYDGKRNWLVDADGTTADFHNGDSVTFTAKNAGTVTLAGDLQASSMTVNGSEYTFEGDGSLYATDLTVNGGDVRFAREINTYRSVLSGTGTKLTLEQTLRHTGAFVQSGGTLIVDLGRLNGAAALSGEGRAELKITGGSLELIGDTATYDGNTYTIASGFGTITSAWTNTCVSGQAEGTNVRYEVRHDDTSVRVSVICDEESHPEPNPEPNPMPVPVP